MAAVTSGANGNIRANAGFTLLEMLLVLAIIAIMSALAMLGISGNSLRVLEAEGDHMLQSLQFAADNAVLQNMQIGMVMSVNSYGFVKYDPLTRSWFPMEEKPLRTHLLSNGFALGLKLEKPFSLPGSQNNVEHKPQLIFLSSGELTAFEISLSLGSLKNPVIIRSDGVSGIVLQSGALVK